MIPLTMSRLEEQGWPGTSLAGLGAGRSGVKTLPVCHMLIPGNGGAEPLMVPVYPSLSVLSSAGSTPKDNLKHPEALGRQKAQEVHGCNRANSKITSK